MLSVSPLTENIGSEIKGVNLAAENSDQTVAEIAATLAQRGVVVIRDQSLSIAQFVGFCRRLGPLDIHLLNQFAKPGFPELNVNSNIIENGKPIGLADAGRYWHTDGGYIEKPYQSTILYSVEIPFQDGVALGDTIFASTAAAYDALPEPKKKSLGDMRAIHAHGVARERRGREHALALDATQVKEMKKGISHPVVRTHPTTNRKCLYLDEGTTRGIDGMDDAESQALIKQILEHVLQPRFMYRHSWRVGDILMWDNCSTIHCAIGDYKLPLRRLIYKALVTGTVPQ